MATTATININVNSKQAEGTVDKLSNSINNAGGSAASLKAQLRQITQELQGLEPGSKRFQDLSQKAGELRDQIADTNAVITAVAGNTVEVFGRALTSTIQVGVAGFQALQSAQVLFGAENEELQKTLVQMGALLNLSQALETFSGLDQKLVEIRAGFTPLLQQLGLMATTQTEVAVATGAADAALVGEAVAADGAAVSTGLFATALNALPLVAIVTALGLLVAGLISYASASGDADKASKKRNAALKAQREEEEKARKTIAEESAEYVGLIYQLKATNAGSKERETLIKQINATYGTTIKNLKDETAFQQSLNLEVANYIAYQKAKFQLQKNEDLVKANLLKQDEIQKKINKTLGERKFYDKEIERLNKLQDPQGIQSYRDKQAELNKVIAGYKSELDAAEKRLLAYGKVNLDVNAVINDVTKGGKQYTKQTNESTSSTEDATDANEKYAKVLEEVKNKLERELAVQETTEKLRSDRLSGLEKETSAINNLYGDERQQIIDRALQNELEALDTKFKKEGKSEEDYIKAAQLIRDNYQTYLLDSEKKLLEQLDVYQKEDLQRVQDNYTTKEKIVQETTQNILTSTQLLQIQFEKEEQIRQIEESAKTEEEKNKAKIEVRKKYAQQEIDLLEKSLEEQKRIEKLKLDETLTDTDKTISEKEQAQADYDKKIIEMTQQTADKINEINSGIKPPLDQTKLEKSVEDISKYVDAIAGLYNQLATTIGMIQDERFANEEAKIEGLYNYEKIALDNQLAEGIISRQEYDNKLTELDQQRERETLMLRRQEFESNKKLNIANAIINGAQAVLSTFAGTPGGIIIKSIAAGLAAAFSAIQVGVISGQEFRAAGGGIVPGMGSGNIDSVPSLLAPGETVINAQSSAMYPELLNQVNMAGGGISLKPDLPATNTVNPEIKFFGDNKKDQPIRAYVVETDVTDTQRRVDRIKRSAEF